jgi:hypothetical protein
MARMRLNIREAEGDLPMVCMRCGAPATVVRPKRMSWYPRWVWILILVNLLVVIIVAVILTKRATLEAPLCNDHKNHWSNRMIIGFGSFVLLLVVVIGIIVLMAEASPEVQNALGGIAVLGCLAAGLAWLVLLAVLASTAIRPAEITDTNLLLDGVAPAFSDAFEEAKREREMRLWEMRRDRRDDDDEYIPRPVRPADAIEADESPPRPPRDAIEE